MNTLKLLFIVFIPVFAFSQNKKQVCKCPFPYPNAKPQRIFKLSKGHSIALCGGIDTGTVKGKILYSEFTLSVCGANKAIKFWDAIISCNVRVSHDTLIVETFQNLPVGKNMQYLETPCNIEHIWFRNNKLFRDSTINPRLHKYTKAQIAEVLNLYNHTPNLNDDKTAELADKLLISTFSGSKIAEYYLVNFRKKFTRLDGAIFESYDATMRIFNLWKLTH